MWGKFWYEFGFAALLVACSEGRAVRGGFVGTRGSQFVINGRPFYFNGFNSYWLMYMASDPSTRVKVSDTFAQAAKYGMNVVRTWAFSDGGYRALQTAPGICGKAKKHGIYLILSLVNNWEGGAEQSEYNNWSSLQRRSHHICMELMNEPRCQSDLSGKSIQDWVAEMSAYLKSMDKNHLLEIGMEGFYGESMPEKKQNNPGYEVGTDFIANNRIPQVDFATIHLYPDQWVPGSSDGAQEEFVEKWIQEHINDSQSILKKPMVVSEFGKSSRSSGYTVEARKTYFGLIFDQVCTAAQGLGARAEVHSFGK
ncbi:UNVERIFIED_CONTAM: putative mannan endo-1,4-beta-mannosidase 9 [Sesamum angustifolium]|uniref:mannan endo-1,4-beta-mannosidase n=1 Tax=Sesamum angustifolium TaxID=2727405 RepID=A0AAW2RL79_9LAMI